MPVFEISRDIPELERSALEMMEHSAKAQALGKRSNLLPAPAVPEAYLLWLEFLFSLERRFGSEPAAALRLRADVAEGLQAIRRARSSFERKYKRCQCGKWVPILTKLCLCGNKF